jgi:hypothetical protein
MILDAGRIVEFDKPGVLLADPQSQFYALCKATGRDEFSSLLRLSHASSYYSTSSSIRGSRSHTPGPNTSTYHHTTITNPSDLSWRDAETELERDGSPSTPEVIENVTEAEQVEPPPRYEATPSPTPIRKASEKKPDDSADSSLSEDGGGDRQALTAPVVVIEEPKDSYDEGDDDRPTDVQEESSQHHEHSHDDEGGYVLARKESRESEHGS